MRKTKDGLQSNCKVLAMQILQEKSVSKFRQWFEITEFGNV